MKLLPLPLKELLRRIEAKTEKTASCWLWQGHLHHGSPQLALQHKGQHYSLSVRRLIWLALYGPVNPLNQIRTSCGIERCIRDMHLMEWSRLKINIKASRSPRNRRLQDTSPYGQEVVLRAVQLYHSGDTLQAVSNKLGIPANAIHGWVSGEHRRPDTHLGRIPGGYWHRARHVKGESVGGNKLTWQTVLIICGLRRAGYSLKAIASSVNCRWLLAREICNGSCWKWLTGDLTPIRVRSVWPIPSIDDHASSFLTGDELAILERYRIIRSCRRLAKEMGRSREFVAALVKAILQKLQSVPTEAEVYPDDALVYKYWKGGQ